MSSAKNSDGTPSPEESNIAEGSQGAEGSSTDRIRYVNLYESEGKIYTRKISGLYQSIRRYSVLPLVIAYVLMPWLVIDGRPAMLFDLPARQFHILWLTLWPQDFILLAATLIISAFGLFTVTALFGRVWCGFTCPQTAWTLMFISLERVFEGSRNQQIKLDKQAWSVNKVLRKGGKHASWVLVAFITGLTFIAYFVPIRELILGLVPHRDEFGMITFGAHPVAVFWILFFTGMTYLNAGWLRVQVCKYMCPYARFQSAMYDRDTLAVHYDTARGEPRGHRKTEDTRSHLGDCVDCSWCVQVCPVDIDIRDGMQYECINCGLCVDACNAVMDKMSTPRGLIRFTSENQLAGKIHHIFRPRLFVYLTVLSALIGSLAFAVMAREPIGMDVSRDRGLRLYRLRSGMVENVYTVKVYNMDNVEHSYKLNLENEDDFILGTVKPIWVEAGGKSIFPVKVRADKNSLSSEKSEVVFVLRPDDGTNTSTKQKVPFFGPEK